MLNTLIVGQGLAGSLLGIELIQLGQKILVIDDNHKTSSTKIAAGMMNPIKGKRLAKLWNSKKDQDLVIAYYQSLEKKLKTTFLHKHRLIRFLSKDMELQAYKKKRKDPDYIPYLQDIPNHSLYSTVCDPGKYQFITHPVYQVDTQALLSATKAFLQKNKSYLESDFEYDDLKLNPGSVSWQTYQAKQLFFCEGARGCNNPYFKHLTFENAMGEILEIECSGLPEKTILNHGKWLCPMGNGHYKYGTTSYWEDTENARRQSENSLKTSLEHFLKKPYHLNTVLHGTRPVLKSRTPYVGYHPSHSNIGMINGLGGQGLSLAPTIISNLISKLKENTHPLSPAT